MPSLATSRWLSRFAVAVALPAASLPLAAQTHERSSAAPQAAGRAPALRVIPNDNRTRAGTLRGEILSVALEATEGMWYPDGDAAPGVLMQAFAEAGGAPRIPGPLVRTTAGTPIALTIRNALDVPITVSGLHGGNAPDTVQLGAGATRAIRVRFDSVGTYYYWGTSTGRTFDNRFGMDAQLSGAIVIDPAGAPAARDRVFVLGMWADTSGRVLTTRKRVLVVVNGRSWPHTERLQGTVGDTVQWRIINASADSHPMHLHGFYFRVDGRGNGIDDKRFAPTVAEWGNTEPMPPGATIDLTWIPERAGNWLFHCHLPDHFAARGSLGLARPAPVPGASHAAHGPMNHALQEMNGLVMGVQVRDRIAPHVVAGAPARALRLLVRENTGSTAATPYFAFAIQEGAAVPPVDSGLRVGPPIVLVRGQPVRITVVNGLREATAVHWHGIELDSYYDGVAGFSGAGKRLSPVIAPNDSFEVRFTPPRAGTFIYHTHVDEERQQLAGLAGPLLVVEPGARDVALDHSVLVTSPGEPSVFQTAVLLNGRLSPAPLELVAGVANRIRIVNITTRRPNLRVELRDDNGIVAWRPISKDGRDIPSAGRTLMPGTRVVSIGETFDFEIVPGDAGRAGLRLEMYSVTQRLGAYPIVVRQ